MNPIDPTEIGARISNIRKNIASDKKMTLENFGKLLSPPANKSLVRKWEKGQNLPKGDRLAQIAKLGNVTVEYLLFGRELSGYGKNIRSIREAVAGDNIDLFCKSFTPNISNKIVFEWENEINLPDFEQLERLSELSQQDSKELLFNFKEPYSELRSINSNFVFEQTQKAFRTSNLTLDEYLISDWIFFHTNRLRKAQLKTSNSCSEADINSMLDMITWLMDLNEPSSYDYSNDSVKQFKQYKNLEEEADSAIKELNKLFEKMKHELLSKHQKN